MRGRAGTVWPHARDQCLVIVYEAKGRVQKTASARGWLCACARAPDLRRSANGGFARFPATEREGGGRQGAEAIKRPCQQKQRTHSGHGGKSAAEGDDWRDIAPRTVVRFASSAVTAARASSVYCCQRRGAAARSTSCWAAVRAASERSALTWSAWAKASSRKRAAVASTRP